MAKFVKPVSDAKLVAKNTLVLYIRMLAVMFIGLFTSRIQLQALGVDNYGLYQVAMVTVGLFAFLNGSLGMASSRFLTVEMGRGTIGSLKRVFSTVLIAHFAMGALIVLLLETVGIFVLETKLNIAADRIFAVKWAYQCGVLTTFLGVTQVPYSAVIIAHERMSAFAFMTFVDVGVKLLIVYLLFISPFDRLIVYATLLACASCLSIAIYRIYCVRHFTEARFRFVFEKERMKPIMGFVGWQVLSQIVYLTTMQTITLLNQRYFGPVVVAAGAIGASVYAQINGFINNFKVAANPQIIKLFAAREYSQSKRLLTQTIHFSTYLLLVLGVPIWFYAPEILQLWLGENVPKYADGFLRVILIGAFFSNFDYSMFTIVYADGRMKYNTICDLVFYPLTFTMVWISIIYFGNPLTTAIGQATMSVVLGLLVKPLLLKFMVKYSLRDFWRIFASPFLSLVLCVAMTYLVCLFMPTNTWLLLVNCALAAFLNAFLIFSVCASRAVQDQVPKMLLRFGRLGEVASRMIMQYLVFLRSLKSPLMNRS